MSLFTFYKQAVKSPPWWQRHIKKGCHIINETFWPFSQSIRICIRSIDKISKKLKCVVYYYLSTFLNMCTIILEASSLFISNRYKFFIFLYPFVQEKIKPIYESVDWHIKFYNVNTSFSHAVEFINIQQVLMLV